MAVQTLKFSAVHLRNKFPWRSHMAQTSADGLSFHLENVRTSPVDVDTSTAAFQDEMHQYRSSRFNSTATANQIGDGQAKYLTVAASDGQSGGSSGFGTAMNYAGYMTYIGLAAGAFGHDDPFNIQTKATRFFQEKILHHHAVDSPQVWMAMGDALMTEQHLAANGAKFKPLKLKT
ncbi:MAG: hypothetical protein ACREMY_24955, partial [bacterium]